MAPLRSTAPEQFVTDFFTGFNDELALLDPDDDFTQLMERYYTRDIVQISDGVRLDWDRLLAHLPPVRKRLGGGTYRFDVQEALADGDRIAARLTLHVRDRKGRVIDMEIQMIARFTPDGRMRGSHQLCRTLRDAKPSEQPSGPSAR
ncbi:nuclear transport factor 2 family protein [Streptomyces silaceus]|uniref:nuclear transport factor 2 family protein n=1 Tax=Streptomyces silaceus TaxID=545123 RepID=UPI0006EB30D9|nr:nuclear transport factor 2 family protein [Streptomyces silaceus]